MNLPDNGLKLEKSGLAYSREFFDNIARNWFAVRFPDQMQYMAFGLAGEGSECFGFDDHISTDHDYKIGFCIWMPEDLYREKGQEIDALYKQLPNYGIQPSPYMKEQGQGRHGVQQIDTWYKQFLGAKGLPETPMDWLNIPQANLCAATNGLVFEDNLGEFSRIRETLKSYYPRDIRIKKMATAAIKMAHYGQANFARMMRRNDIVAAQICIDKFVQATIHMIYLMNKEYAPYYKWMWRGMENLSTLGEVKDLLYELVAAGLDPKRWETEKWSTYQYALNTNDPCIVIIEEICKKVADEFRRVGLSQSESSYLEGHAYEAILRIRDPQIRGLSIMYGE